MTLRYVTDLDASIGDVLNGSTSDGVIIETPDKTTYAVIPLDEDLVDYLLDRNPRLIRECRAIRNRMRRGKFYTHEQMRHMTGRKSKRSK